LPKERVSSSRPMHQLLKWNPDEGEEILEAHLNVANRYGTVWWACWTTCKNRQIGAKHSQQLNRQLRLGIPTYAFLYRTGEFEEVWRATLVSFRGHLSATDHDRLPYDRQSFAFFELSDFDPLSASWPMSRLGLWNNATSGPLTWEGLHNQSSPMYVYELGKHA